MSDFKQAFKKLNELEYSKPENYLHKNKGENDYTVGGIYKYANPNWPGWYLVNIAIANNSEDITKASVELFNKAPFREMVSMFYEDKYWNAMKLNQIIYQNTAEEIFLFGVNAGKRTAIRKAQKVVGVKEDGLIGPQTINALNNFPENEFDMKFDEIEKQYYSSLIDNNPSFKIFDAGWRNRAEYV